MHQGRDAPARDPPIELDTLRWRQPVPEIAAMDVDEVVSDQPAIAVEQAKLDQWNAATEIGWGQLEIET
jgi:hypothetical protein